MIPFISNAAYVNYADPSLQDRQPTTGGTPRLQKVKRPTTPATSSTSRNRSGRAAEACSRCRARCVSTGRMTERAGRRAAPGTSLADKGSPAAPFDLFGRGARPDGPGSTESLTTVIVAFGANVLVAAAEVGRRPGAPDRRRSWPRRPTPGRTPATRSSCWSPAAGRAARPTSRTRSGTAGRPTSGRCSPRSGCSWPVPRCRWRTASRNSSGRSLLRDFAVGHIELAVSFVLEGVSLCSRSGRPGPAQSLARGPDRACAGHLRPDLAGGVRRGLRRAGWPAPLRPPGWRPPAHRVGCPGRCRVDPGRPAARRHRGAADQPQPAVPGRPGSRPPAAGGHHRGPAGRVEVARSPTCGWRSSGPRTVSGDRRRRPDR